MLLSIVVLSYNRPVQIRRILEELIGYSSRDFNLIIKDDLSPRISEITNIVIQYRPLLGFDLELHINKNNMGYDLNLLDAFNVSSSEYVFLLSDDDYLSCNGLEKLLMTLAKREHNVYFTPYQSGSLLNRSSVGVYQFDRFSEIIYNSILFSGLVFNRQSVLVLGKDVSFLSHCIYSQVYLAAKIIYKDASFGFIDSPTLLLLGGDGENFFGKNTSATNSEALSDRTHLLSNLRYQNFLLTTVKKISTETNARIYVMFIKEYKRRLYSYALRVRSTGIKNYSLFVKALSPQQHLNYFLVFCIFIFPAPVSKIINSMLIRAFKKSG